jgi:hypothetical protein
MAYRRRYGGRMMRRARSYGGRARRSFRSYRKSGGFGGMNIKFIGGIAAGYLAPRLHPMQDLAITTLAVLPVRLPYGIKGIAQGYVMGMIVKNFLPSIGGFAGSQDNFTV